MKKQAETNGELIREARQAKKLTVRALADELAVSPGAISNLENGKVQKIRPEHRAKLLEVLGVELPEETKAVDELGFVFDKLGIEPIQQDLFRRAFGGTVAKRQQDGDESGMATLERKVTSVINVLPNPTTLKLRSPEVVAAMDFIGAQSGESHRDNLDRVLDEVESIIFKGIQLKEHPKGVSQQDAFLYELAKKHQIGIFIVRGKRDVEEKLKEQLIANGFLNLAMEVDELAEKPKYFGVATSSVESGSSHKACILISETTEEKVFRKGFTLAHELAHVLVDPNLKKGNAVHRNHDMDRQSPLEWFVDQVAGRILFPSFWMKPRIAELQNNRCAPFLNMDLVGAFRKQFAPHVSYQAVINALVNYWPIPVLYVEAKQQRVRNPLNSFQLCTSILQVSYTRRNRFADAIGLKLPYYCVVPENSSMSEFYHAHMAGTPVDSWMDCADENFSIWQESSSHALANLKMCMTFSMSARTDGLPVVRAFIMPSEEVSRIRDSYTT